jgi:tRNA dimethylallyltransferase
MSVYVICGATATGKSELGIALSHHLDGEIINADSMQLYRGMDIGTAKLSVHQQRGIPHHLLDVLNVTEDASVAWYQKTAREVIGEIESRGKSPIIVGGTGLYIKAILDDLNFPDTDPSIRAALNIKAEKIGADAMFALLKRLDPAAALAIDANNLRRVIRALEVIEITGRPFSANLPREGSSLFPSARLFGLTMNRDDLDERISQRVDHMWQQGFVAETDALIVAGIRDGSTAQLALGYAQILKYREGLLAEVQAIEETKRATRQYARRQETWFSRDARIQWISLMQPQLATILEYLKQPAPSLRG